MTFSLSKNKSKSNFFKQVAHIFLAFFYKNNFLTKRRPKKFWLKFVENCRWKRLI